MRQQSESLNEKNLFDYHNFTNACSDSKSHARLVHANALASQRLLERGSGEGIRSVRVMCCKYEHILTDEAWNMKAYSYENVRCTAIGGHPCTERGDAAGGFGNIVSTSTHAAATTSTPTPTETKSFTPAKVEIQPSGVCFFLSGDEYCSANRHMVGKSTYPRPSRGSSRLMSGYLLHDLFATTRVPSQSQNFHAAVE